MIVDHANSLKHTMDNIFCEATLVGVLEQELSTILSKLLALSEAVCREFSLFGDRLFVNLIFCQWLSC